MTQIASPKKSLPLVNGGGAKPAAPAVTDEAMEAELRAFEEAERERLGIQAERRQWVDSMLKPKMTKKERDHVTILVSGLTAAQDFFVEGALRGLGYKVEFFGMADNAGLQVGKEFGNRGQCNPTYFTVGALVKHLIDLRDKNGLTSEEVVKNYVFLTAGACGPCRFGMYVTEYRKALRDAGFDGFRVMLFQQTGGLSQATGDDVGLEMNPPFFIGIIKAIVCGDALNALTYRVRPYEVEPGAVNRAVEASKRIIYQALVEQTNIFKALYQCRGEFAKVKLDRLKPRAKTAIIGEFWAMTTEGDGNYQLQKFLESEGGENDIQLTTAWLLYNIWEVSRDTRERRDLRGTDGGMYGLEALDEWGVAKRLAMMRLAEAGLRVGFNVFAWPLGLYGYHLPDMDKVAEVSHEHYSNDLRGGEGHMEVGKLILNVVNQKANITVSVKPFGCMPSSGVSDGVQSLITARYPGTIFCAVETSGDGAVNFYSRVQMYMFKARAAAEADLQKALADTGVTLEQVRAYIDEHPKYQSFTYYPGHTVASTAANVVYEVAPMITMNAAQRARARVVAAAASLKDTVASLPETARKAEAVLRNPETWQRAREDASLLADIVRGKAMEHMGPLAKKVVSETLFGRLKGDEPQTTTSFVAAAELAQASPPGPLSSFVERGRRGGGEGRAREDRGRGRGGDAGGGACHPWCVAAAREIPLLVGFLATVFLWGGMQAWEADRRSAANWSSSHGYPIDGVTRRYGWGIAHEEGMLCGASGVPSTCKAVNRDIPRDDRALAVLAAAGHAALAALALRSLRRRHDELLASVGVDVPVAASDGSYRQPEPPPRRELPEHEQRRWKDRLLVAAGVWVGSIALVSVLGSRAAPAPMPLVVLGWSALTLPAALAYARWREGADWAPWMMGLGAGAMGLMHSFVAVAPALLVLVVCASCAWAQEHDRRREGRWS